MQWTPHPGSGPDAGILGELVGRRVVELGCGPGDNLAYLVSVHGAIGIGVDAAPAQIWRARARYGHLAHLTFIATDAIRYLSTATTEFDVCYSVFGAVGLSQPNAIVSAVATRLRPGGRFAFSVPYPHRPDRSSSPPLDPRPDTLTLPNGAHVPIMRWELDAAAWIRLLQQHGLRTYAVTEPADVVNRRPSCLLVAATLPVQS